MCGRPWDAAMSKSRPCITPGAEGGAGGGGGAARGSTEPLPQPRAPPLPMPRQSAAAAAATAEVEFGAAGGGAIPAVGPATHCSPLDPMHLKPRLSS
jgi:hypothetical protein